MVRLSYLCTEECFSMCMPYVIMFRISVKGSKYLNVQFRTEFLKSIPTERLLCNGSASITLLIS